MLNYAWGYWVTPKARIESYIVRVGGIYSNVRIYDRGMDIIYKIASGVPGIFATAVRCQWGPDKAVDVQLHDDLLVDP